MAAGVSRRSFLAGLIVAAPTSQGLFSYAYAEQEATASKVLCDQAISKLVNPQTKQEIYIVGTAHISEISADLVKSVIDLVKPDTIMVELDESRLRRSAVSREGPKSVWDVIWSQWKRSDLSLGDKIHNVEAGIIGVAIGSLYQKLNKMGFSSGKEFATAINEAKALNANLVLGDRAVNETLIRLQQSIDKTGWNQVQAFARSQSLLPEASVLSKTMESEFEKGENGDNTAIANTVELLKERKTVRKIMQTLRENLPEVYTALIGERDQYMANSLLKANGRKTVAVVGMVRPPSLSEMDQALL